MNRRYVVSYDVVSNPLDTTGVQERELNIIARLRALGAVQALNTQWALRSEIDAVDLREIIRSDFGLSDRLTIIEVAGEVAHWWTIEKVSRILHNE